MTHRLQESPLGRGCRWRGVRSGAARRSRRLPCPIWPARACRSSEQTACREFSGQIPDRSLAGGSGRILSTRQAQAAICGSTYPGSGPHPHNWQTRGFTLLLSERVPARFRYDATSLGVVPLSTHFRGEFRETSFALPRGSARYPEAFSNLTSATSPDPRWPEISLRTSGLALARAGSASSRSQKRGRCGPPGKVRIRPLPITSSTVSPKSLKRPLK